MTTAWSPVEAVGATPLRHANGVSRRELAVLALYFAGTVAVTDVLNVRLGIELLTLMVLVAAFGISRAGMPFLRDWWPFLVGLVMWGLSGPIAAGSPFPWHLEILIQADRLLFFGHDPVLMVHRALVTPGKIGPIDLGAAAVYNLHLPEPYIAGYFIWRLNRTVFTQFVASALTLLVLGFITFILFPTVPPWGASTWLHRIPGIYNGFGAVLHAHPLPLRGTPIFYVWHMRGDSVAEIPSEHAAFPVLELIAFSKVNRRLGALFALWVSCVAFTVVYLGMHWAIDVLAGWTYAVIVFLLVHLVSRRGLRAA